MTGPDPRAPWYRNTKGEWYVVVQVVLFALIAVGPHTVPGWPPWPEPWGVVARWVGFVCMVIGAAFAVGGVFRLGPNLSVLPYPKDCADLIETGPYAVVRHPIYSGLILGAFGWGLYLNAGLTLVWALGLFVLFDAKSRKEEAWLSEKFAGYGEYRTRVKKLIPWVY